MTVEVHIGRLTILVDTFSQNGASVLDGLTKLAKLDFLVRYPVVLEALVHRYELPPLASDVTPSAHERLAVDAPMIRYKYGPWDARYYSLLGGLVGRGLIEYAPGRGRAAFRSTQSGTVVAGELRAARPWLPIAGRIEYLKDNLDISGNQLKLRIYETFPEMVAQPLGTIIRPLGFGDGAQ